MKLKEGEMLYGHCRERARKRLPEELEGGNPRGLVLLQQGAQQVSELLTHSRIDGRPNLRQDLVYPPNTLKICARSMSVSARPQDYLCGALLTWHAGCL